MFVAPNADTSICRRALASERDTGQIKLKKNKICIIKKKTNYGIVILLITEVVLL